MKKTFLTLGTILLLRVIVAQEIQNEVISSTGDTDSIGNILVSWTVGECITEKYCNNYCMVTQGFHQTYYKILQVPEHSAKFLNVTVYPNPTTDILNIDLSELPPGKSYSIILSNMEGKLLFQKETSSGNIIKVYLNQHPEGMMILKVVAPSTSTSSSFKIIKVNR